jgi:hypothetical protein
VLGRSGRAFRSVSSVAISGEILLSSVFLRGLCGRGFGFPITRDVGDSGVRRALRATPPPIFPFLLQTKALTQIRPCATLGWPLGGPRVTQASPNPKPKPNPNPNPNPKQAEGRNLCNDARGKDPRATNCHRERAGFDRESNDLKSGKACTPIRLPANCQLLIASC